LAKEIQSALDMFGTDLLQNYEMFQTVQKSVRE